MTFRVQSKMFENFTGNPDNEIYDIYISGTTNLTSILEANSFLSGGNYYQLAPAAADSKCKIVDQNNDEIGSNSDDDFSMVGIEPNSGVTVIMKERLFYNMLVFNDELFSFDDGGNGLGKFLPLAYFKRESQWT